MGAIRKSLVVAGLLLLLPLEPPEHLDEDGIHTTVQHVSTVAALTAAVDTLADIKGFCERRPQSCSMGKQLANTLEKKAHYGMKLLGNWGNPPEPTVPENTAPTTPINTEASAPDKTEASMPDQTETTASAKTEIPKHKHLSKSEYKVMAQSRLAYQKPKTINDLLGVPEK